MSSVVEHYFDFAEKVLANQRQLVEEWATGAAQLAEVVTVKFQRATRSSAPHRFGGTKPAVDNAVETAGLN